MKKLNKKDYIKLSCLFMIIIVFITILYLNGYVFGSSIDWANQHIVLPEYFRTLFYSDFRLIPKFACNIGLGQNIFYFSYYGLLSPVILISYLFPFISMSYFIQIISVISLFISVYLLYRWINDKYNSKIAFLISLIFILNSPFSYHFHRHLMFVIYMPFMISSLIGVDKYLKKDKPVLLILSVVGLIFTSYYFSVSGIITIGIYTLYVLLKDKKFDYKKLFKVIGVVSISILMSCVILLPTLYALLNGRLDTFTDNIILKQILLPFGNFEQTFYSTYYSWGITLIYIYSIIQAFLKKKKDFIFLAIVSSLFIVLPVCSYLFNAFMYIDGKCFIPFIPVILLLVSEFLNNVFNKKVDYKKISLISIPIIIILIISSIKSYTLYILLFEAISILVIFNIKKDKSKLIYIPIVITSLVCFITSCYYNETYIKKEVLDNINNKDYYEILSNVDKNYRTSVYENLNYNSNKIYSRNMNTSSIYSSASNVNYMNFLRNVFQVEAINRDNTTITVPNNLLFNIYTGTRYIVNNNMLGYEDINTINGIKLYENHNVLPTIYVSNKLMSKREFDTLKYPYSIDALLNYVIVDKDMEDVYNSHVSYYTDEFEVIEKNNVEVSSKGDNLIINADKNANIKLKLNRSIKDEILIIKFKMNKIKEGYACSSNITINGITNALSCSNWKYNNKNYTFEYVLSSNDEFSEINIDFTKDEFNFSDIEMFTIKYDDINSLNDDIYKVELYEDNDSIYSGKVNALEDGYLKITIPYESKGFKLLVDNKEVPIEIVDTAFIGTKINKGDHDIKLLYETPLLKEGLIVSSIGLLIFMFIVIKKKKN